MNNVDVSLIYVLKKLHPTIFNQYFNNCGIIPNPTLAVRNKAKAIFKNYSSENFDDFLQKYRNLVWKLKDTAPKCDTLPNDTFGKLFETEQEKKFEIIQFITGERNCLNCHLLEFPPNAADFISVTNLDLSNNETTGEDLQIIAKLVQLLNRIYHYNLLEIDP